MLPFPQYPHISHVQAKLLGLGESAPSADIVKRPFLPPSANTGDTLAVQVQKLILTSVFLCPLSPHLSRCVIPPPLNKRCDLLSTQTYKPTQNKFRGGKREQGRVGSPSYHNHCATNTYNYQHTLPRPAQFYSHLNADFIKTGRAIPRETCSGRACSSTIKEQVPR